MGTFLWGAFAVLMFMLILVVVHIRKTERGRLRALRVLEKAGVHPDSVTVIGDLCISAEHRLFAVAKKNAKGIYPIEFSKVTAAVLQENGRHIILADRKLRWEDTGKPWFVEKFNPLRWPFRKKFRVLDLRMLLLMNDGRTLSVNLLDGKLHRHTFAYINYVDRLTPLVCLLNHAQMPSS